MKKLILGVLSIALFSISCSSDDGSNPNLTAEEQEILGEWEIVAHGFVNPNGSETTFQNNNTCKNTHTFTADKNVKYISYSSCSQFYEEDGTWTLVDGLLTRTFPEDVVLIMAHNITFINPDRIKLFAVGDNTNFTIYQRAGTTFDDTSFKVEVTGSFQTDWCNATGNTAKIKFEFLQDNNVFATQNEQSTTEQSITVERNLSGGIIGVRIKLTDYNPNNLNAALGDGFDVFNIKITGNQTQEVLVNTNPPLGLVSCSDICYEVIMLYNTSTQEITFDSIWI